MKVILVIPAMASSAGAETSLFAITPDLLRAGLELHYVVLTEHQDLVPPLRALGVTVTDLSGLRLPKLVLELRRLFRRERPDVVHATLFQASLPTELACIGGRPPVLVSWANTPVVATREGLSPWKVAVIRGVERTLGVLSRSRYHAVTAGVARTKAAELHVPAARVRVAERGRDASRFAPRTPEQRASIRAALGVAPEDRLIVATGRQEPQKGYPDLLRAVDDLIDRHPQVRLLVAGREGSGSPAIREVLASARHADRITMLGHRDDIPDLLAAADVAVCASHREGAAGALLEAMAAGTPIVSVELDGAEGVLEDGVNAVVVPRARLAEGLERVVTDPAGASERARTAHEHFEHRFTIERSAAALVDVYRWAARR